MKETLEIKSQNILDIFDKYNKRGLRINLYTFEVSEGRTFYLYSKNLDVSLRVNISSDYSKFDSTNCHDLNIKISFDREQKRTSWSIDKDFNRLSVFIGTDKLRMLADFIDEVSAIVIYEAPEFLAYVENKAKLAKLEKEKEELIEKLEKQLEGLKYE